LSRLIMLTPAEYGYWRYCVTQRRPRVSKLEVRRLGDLRLGQQEVDRQVGRRAHLRVSLGRRRGDGTMELLGAAEHAVRFAGLRERRAQAGWTFSAEPGASGDANIPKRLRARTP
jgi:hypothetical protein